MSQKLLKYFLFSLVLCLYSCAKRGSITGGAKDTLAPELVSSFPENFSAKFNTDKIKLVFNENIKIKDLNKQLIISPPMKYEPIILPTTATKKLSITIKDTLQPNTTYSLNFGQSVADNNEGNPYNQFKYVFSTGDYVDSLALGGRVKDALDREAPSFVSVMLYEANEKFNDSTIYKEVPRYITNTLDSLKTWRLENLKPGAYHLIALKDNNKNNKFNPKTDKIAFNKGILHIPNDTVFELELFKENLPLKFFKPSQASGNKMIVGYEGTLDAKADMPQFSLKHKGEAVPFVISKMAKKDSLHLWFKPQKMDSLTLSISKDKYEKSFSFKVKNQKKDTLSLKPIQTAVLNFRERFTLESNTPLLKFDKSKIKLFDKDSVAVAFSTAYDELNQQMFIDFKRDEDQKYQIRMLPGAVTDFFEKTNDSLHFKLSTRSYSEYSNLTVSLKNAKRFPIIVQLTDEAGQVVKASEYTEGKTEVEFNLLEPAIYMLRAIYDDNKNKQWDTGSYMEKRQAEEITYRKLEDNIRSNWDPKETFDLSIPYNPEQIKKKKPQEKKKSSF